MAAGELLPDGGRELVRRRDVDAAHASRPLKRDVGRDQGDLRPPPGAMLRQRQPHASARAVADEADGVDRLSGPAGGDEHAQPVPRSSRGGEERLDLGQQTVWRRQPADAPFAARGERSLLGLDHPHIALAQGRQVRLGGGIRVHTVVHRRGNGTRRRAGQERCGQHRVGDPGGELGDRVRRRRCDQVDVGVGGQLEVADGVVVGEWIAREGATEGIAPELVGQHRRADDALERGRPHESLRGGRHQHANAVPSQGRQAGQLQGLVGGDAAAHAEEDAGHLGRPTRAPARRRGSGI